MWRLCRFLICAVLCVGLPFLAVAGEHIRITNGEWPPYFSPKFLYGGVGTRLCTEAFALEDVEAEYLYMPWKRALETAREGDYDAALGWRKTPELEESFLFSDPLFDQELVFFHRMGSSFDWQSLDDVGHLRMGGTIGYSWVKEMQDLVSRHGGTLDCATLDKLNFAKLAAGRIDIFPCSKAVGLYVLRTQFLPGVADTIQHHPKLINQGTLYLLVSKKHPRGRILIESFNHGLSLLRESGKFDQYMQESLMGKYLPDAVVDK